MLQFNEMGEAFFEDVSRIVLNTWSAVPFSAFSNFDNQLNADLRFLLSLFSLPRQLCNKIIYK